MHDVMHSNSSMNILMWISGYGDNTIRCVWQNHYRLRRALRISPWHSESWRFIFCGGTDNGAEGVSKNTNDVGISRVDFLKFNWKLFRIC